MKIKDIIRTAAIYLGRERIIEYLENGENTLEDANLMSQINNLTRCANLVINELCCNYVPMVKSETVDCADGKIYFSELSETVLEIEKVTDTFGENVEYSFSPEFLTVSLPTVIVTYKFLPPTYGLTDEIGYSERDLGRRVIAYGVAAEFLLTEHDFNESVMWHDRFTDALSRVVKIKNSKIKGRSFI